jgi:hypothetical protein
VLWFVKDRIAPISDPNQFFRPRASQHPFTPLPVTIRSDARYHSGFWVAFKNSLDANFRRYLTEQFRHFVDLPLEAAAPPNSFELDRSYIVGIDGPLPPIDAVRIHNAITRFISDHSINPALVYREAASLPSTRSAATTSDPGVNWDSELANLARGLNQLKYSELARINIPLDIVLDLLKKQK